jgi:hypothetical protein
MDFSWVSSRLHRDIYVRCGTIVMLFVMAAGFLTAGCTSLLPSTSGVPGASAAPTPWAGEWNSDWGIMTFSQNGDQVTGTYTHDNGKVKGTVKGNTLTGTWSESPSYSPPNDAGDFVITIAADGKSFTGQWKYGSDVGDWDGKWDATRK